MDLWIDIALSVLLASIKSPMKVQAYRRGLVKLRDALNKLPLDGEGNVVQP